MAENKTSIGNWAGMALGAAGTIGSWLGIGEKRQDRRQVEQQGKLNALGVQSGKEMLDYQKQKDMEMWHNTNLAAQMEEADKAGLSKAWMMGKGGGSPGQIGASGAAMSGGAASDASSASNAATNKAMAIGQLSLLTAQAEKLKAETQNLKSGVPVNEEKAANLKGGTANTAEQTKALAWENAVRAEMPAGDEAKTRKGEQETRQINSEKANAEWEAFKTAAFDGKTFNDENNPMVKAMRAGYAQVEQALKNSKTQGDIATATKTIEEFKANLAKQGIAPDSPWYVKILGDLLAKLGMNPISGVKTAVRTATKM